MVKMNPNSFDLSAAITALENRKTILYPTDTIWGLGCDATNNEACEAIIKLKNRTGSHSFIVLVDSFNMVERYIPEFPSVCYDLVELSEEPLTIIYPNARGLADSVVAEDFSVGIRITRDPICLQLIRALKKPIVSTSANISGQPHPTCFDEINESLKNNVGAIVNERITEQLTTPSKIIKIGIDSSVKIIRG